MPDPFRCAVCAHYYPVPSLARDCEVRHAEEHAR